MARLGVKRAISPGYAAEWCAQKGEIGYFEVDTNRPHGIMEALRYICDEYLLLHPPQGAPVMREPRAVPGGMASEREKDELPWARSGATDGGPESAGAAAAGSRPRPAAPSKATRAASAVAKGASRGPGPPNGGAAAKRRSGITQLKPR